ncbi:DODA-type extradiol aromatic ring-opening family dioxygenase [Francisella sciaenopsi]|uniref:Class III extradiol ring-cleavage dioxygenase n=1 Tax=Francisella sciaenopsi TaxID=3055034 RepID=A0ABQ6PGM4_9GAMM
MSTQQNQHQTIFISHGGGPLPLLGDKNHQELVNALQTLSQKFKKPEAIIVISAHWEEPIVTITAKQNPSLIYDYYGFPEESYNIKYPAFGNPELANKLYNIFNNLKIPSKLDFDRGFDHGLFVPLKIMYPNADIPCIQISLNQNLDPSQHINIGEAISQLDQPNLLIIGSGFSFHNMRAFFNTSLDKNNEMNKSFEKWLVDTCSNRNLTEQERTHKLINWEDAPNARYCHPREEHLIPLHVCYGANKTACKEYQTLSILNKESSIYIW